MAVFERVIQPGFSAVKINSEGRRTLWLIGPVQMW